MTIKEVELKTGLVRANIRYYEDQGFFVPDRGENGYRNYSEENVDTLLKIKLLRQLGFSLEDIHALQNGEQSLGAALAEREAGLDAERQVLDQALNLCRVMREEGADFYTLDAQRYLERLSRVETVIQQDQDPVRIFSWRRYFARELDLVLYQGLITLILQLFARVNIIRLKQDLGQSFLLALGALVLMLGVETLSLTLTGTTPGKALLGLKILREDGSKLSLEEAGQRTAYVMLFYGFSRVLIGSGVVLFAIGGVLMMAWACYRVYHEKPLYWEEDYLYLDGSTREQTFWERPHSLFNVGGYVAAWAACVGLIMGGHYLASLPPHRGANLTAEQFVENYNQCMAFTYGESNLLKRLTMNGSIGAFEEKEEPEGVYSINLFGDSPVPDAYFFFGQGGRGLYKVILTRKYEGSGPLGKEDTYGVGIPYDEIYTAMRSFLWNRLGRKGVDALYEELVNQEGNYHTTLGGVQIDSDMRFTGYNLFGENALFAERGKTQSYFVEFTMELT